jgi:hypothetical protein
VVGVIQPGVLYDTDAVMSYAGIGAGKLRELKDAGRIRPYPGIGNRIWYRGEDLIALITEEVNATR